MAHGHDWHIFGASAISIATERPLPKVVDVFFAGSRPTRTEIERIPAIDSTRQIRYSTIKTLPIVNLDTIEVRPLDQKFLVCDSESVLSSREVRVLRFDFSLIESIRIYYLMKFFCEFSWPSFLRLKIECDYTFAVAGEAEDIALSTEIMNFEYDFGV